MGLCICIYVYIHTYSIAETNEHAHVNSFVHNSTDKHNDYCGLEFEGGLSTALRYLATRHRFQNS